MCHVLGQTRLNNQKMKRDLIEFQKKRRASCHVVTCYYYKKEKKTVFSGLQRMWECNLESEFHVIF